MDCAKDDASRIVLVAEDETLVRLLANDMLTDADYRVVEAHDGQELWRSWARRTPSVRF
jgi:CheY-like chemotaxis protein